MALGVAAALAGCGGGVPVDRDEYFQPIRYRLTAEVETPKGSWSGSSVIEAKNQSPDHPGPGEG